jgi:hypothetical protein
LSFLRKSVNIPFWFGLTVQKQFMALFVYIIKISQEKRKNYPCTVYVWIFNPCNSPVTVTWVAVIVAVPHFLSLSNTLTYMFFLYDHTASRFLLKTICVSLLHTVWSENYLWKEQWLNWLHTHH